MGHKWINQLAATLDAATEAFMLFIPNANWLFPVFILMNLSLAGPRISRMSITMEFGSLDKLPTFVALSNTLLAVPMLLAPVAGGWIIDIFGYRWLFILAITFYLIGWFMLWMGIQDPLDQARFCFTLTKRYPTERSNFVIHQIEMEQRAMHNSLITVLYRREKSKNLIAG